MGNILLVGGGGHTDHIGVHQVPDGFCGVLGQHQRPQRHHAHQLAAAVGHIAVVDGLLVKAVLADGLHGLRHRHVRAQLHQLGGHHAASGVLRVLEQFVDHAAGGGVGLAQNALDHIGRQLLHHVDGVVNIQLFDDAGKLRIGDGVDDRLLLLDLEVGEHGRRDLLGHDTEHHGHPLRVILPQLAEELGNVKLVHLAELLAQRLHPVLIEKCKELVDTTPGFNWPRVRTRYSALMACTAKLMSMISAGWPSPAARLTSRPCAMT